MPITNTGSLVNRRLLSPEPRTSSAPATKASQSVGGAASRANASSGTTGPVAGGARAAANAANNTSRSNALNNRLN